MQWLVNQINPYLHDVSEVTMRIQGPQAVTVPSALASKVCAGGSTLVTSNGRIKTSFNFNNPATSSVTYANYLTFVRNIAERAVISTQMNDPWNNPYNIYGFCMSEGILDRQPYGTTGLTSSWPSDLNGSTVQQHYKDLLVIYSGGPDGKQDAKNDYCVIIQKIDNRVDYATMGFSDDTGEVYQWYTTMYNGWQFGDLKDTHASSSADSPRLSFNMAGVEFGLLYSSDGIKDFSPGQTQINLGYLGSGEGPPVAAVVGRTSSNEESTHKVNNAGNKISGEQFIFFVLTTNKLRLTDGNSNNMTINEGNNMSWAFQNYQSRNIENLQFITVHS